jgi:pantoate--beta-alanine ligase
MTTDAIRLGRVTGRHRLTGGGTPMEWLSEEGRLAAERLASRSASRTASHPAPRQVSRQTPLPPDKPDAASPVIAQKSEMSAFCDAAHASGKTIALVPTMGALHEGHLSLVRRARESADVTVVSIFVNPTQFAQGEDLGSYPRDLAADLDALAPLEVDAVFHPSAEEMYGPGTAPALGFAPPADMPLFRLWEAACRPGHFEGVMQVVSKLFNITRCDVACFGEKDFQQLAVIECMVRTLDMGVALIACPTLRDPSGLALSSRNAYLDDAQRVRARALKMAIDAALADIEAGERDTGRIASGVSPIFESNGVELDYFSIVDSRTLCPIDVLGKARPASRVDGRDGSHPGEEVARILVAARLDGIHLIDNHGIPALAGEGGLADG